MSSKSDRLAVRKVFKAFALNFMQAVRPSLREYFGESAGPFGPRLSLTDKCKVVARLEVRRSGAYLDVSLGEVGEQGKEYLHTAVSMAAFDQSVAMLVGGQRLTKSQLEELRRQATGVQATYGCHRAKVQNRLVGLGFSRFSADERSCEITPLGTARLVLSGERK